MKFTLRVLAVCALTFSLPFQSNVMAISGFTNDLKLMSLSSDRGVVAAIKGRSESYRPLQYLLETELRDGSIVDEPGSSVKSSIIQNRGNMTQFRLRVIKASGDTIDIGATFITLNEPGGKPVFLDAAFVVRDPKGEKGAPTYQVVVPLLKTGGFSLKSFDLESVKTHLEQWKQRVERVAVLKANNKFNSSTSTLTETSSIEADRCSTCTSAKQGQCDAAYNAAYAAAAAGEIAGMIACVATGPFALACAAGVAAVAIAAVYGAGAIHGACVNAIPHECWDACNTVN